MHELLADALTQLRKKEKDPKYEINMDVWWEFDEGR